VSVDKDEGIKRAAELLKQGATMLDLACPLDGLPLFRLKNGDVVCPVHGKVYVVENESQMKQIQGQAILERTEEVLMKGIDVMSQRLMKDPSDPDAVVQIIRLLDALERLRKIRAETQGKK
jgi:UPF0148 protein